LKTFFAHKKILYSNALYFILKATNFTHGLSSQQQQQQQQQHQQQKQHQHLQQQQ